MLIWNIGLAIDPLSPWGYWKKPVRGLLGGSLLYLNIWPDVKGGGINSESPFEGTGFNGGAFLTAVFTSLMTGSLVLLQAVCPIFFHLSDKYVPGPYCVPAMGELMVNKTGPGPAFLRLSL